MRPAIMRQSQSACVSKGSLPAQKRRPEWTAALLFHIFRALWFDATPLDCYYQVAGWSSLVARWAHNPKVASSNLAPATNSTSLKHCGRSTYSPPEIFPRQPAPSTSPHFTAKFTKTSNRGRPGICLSQSESACVKGSKVRRPTGKLPPEWDTYPENSGVLPVFDPTTAAAILLNSFNGMRPQGFSGLPTWSKGRRATSHIVRPRPYHPIVRAQAAYGGLQQSGPAQ